jgi:hypothetical protein
VFPIANATYIPNYLNREVRRVLFLDNVSNFHYPQNKIEQMLRREFNKVKSVDFYGGLRVLEFKR